MNDGLKNNAKDYSVMVARAIASAIPFAGGAIAELLTVVIPNQRADRVNAYLNALTARLDELHRQINGNNPRSVDLLETTVIASARAVSPDRNKFLANFMVDSADVSVKQYETDKKLLQVLEELTDTDLEVLRGHRSFVASVSLERQWPAGRQMSYADQQNLPVDEKYAIESERIALQVHRDTLVRYGLLKMDKDDRLIITTFGRLLLTRAFRGEFDPFAAEDRPKPQ